MENYINFFSSWSNNMAYVLGFVAADGYVHGETYRLEYSSGAKDKDHLEKIRTTMGCPQEVFYRPDYNTYCLRVHSKKIFGDLEQLGIHQGKSLTLQWIEKCPQEYISHMVRGYFDGDGYIGIAREKHLNVEILGTMDFLSGINNHFHFLHEPVLKTGSRVYRLRAYGKFAFDFCDWIYKNADLKMIRKYDTYIRAISEAPPGPPKTSQWIGVTQYKGCKKWNACVRINRKTTHLGSYTTELEAALVYNEYIKSHNLEKKLNVIPQNLCNKQMDRMDT